jgi:exopolysaccharide production protein ExoZ
MRPTDYSDSGARSQKNDTIQALRFFAALTVVFDHIIYFASSESHKTLVHVDGRFGVDIFFVISGFIMISIASRPWHWTETPQSFAWKRFSRIVPLYWIATVLYGALRMAPDLIKHGEFKGWPLQDWLKSLLFFPYRNDVTHLMPILGVGWTLNLEVFFYAIFAFSLTLTFKRGLGVLFGSFICLVVVGRLIDWYLGQTVSVFFDSTPVSWLIPIRFWTHPIILLFLVGVLIGLTRMHLLKAGRTIEIPYASGLALAGIIAVIAVENIFEQLWLSRMGLEAAAAVVIVMVAVFARPASHPSRLTNFLSRLGDASYALYLFHSIVLICMVPVWKRVDPQFNNVPVLTIFIAILSIAVSVAVHKRVELPLTEVFRNVRGSRPKLSV